MAAQSVIINLRESLLYESCKVRKYIACGREITDSEAGNPQLQEGVEGPAGGKHDIGSWEHGSCGNWGAFPSLPLVRPISFWPPASPSASVPALYFVPISLLRQVVPNGHRWSLALGNLEACGKGTCKRPVDPSAAGCFPGRGREAPQVAPRALTVGFRQASPPWFYLSSLT